MILAEVLWQGVQLPPFPALSHLAWLMIPICRSMLKSSLVAPMLELCCEALHEKPPQNGDDSVRSAMMAVHEALKSPSFQGTSPLLRSDLSDEQARLLSCRSLLMLMQ